MLLVMTIKPPPPPAILVPKYWDEEGNEQKEKDPSAYLPEAEFLPYEQNTRKGKMGHMVTESSGLLPWTAHKSCGVHK